MLFSRNIVIISGFMTYRQLAATASKKARGVSKA